MELNNSLKNKPTFSASIIKAQTIEDAGRDAISTYIDFKRIISKKNFDTNTATAIGNGVLSSDTLRLQKIMGDDILILNPTDFFPNEFNDLRRLKKSAKPISFEEITEDIRKKKQTLNEGKIFCAAAFCAGILAILLSINAHQGKKYNIDDKFTPPNDCILPREASCTKEMRYDELIRGESLSLLIKSKIRKKVGLLLCPIPKPHRKAVHPVIKGSAMKKLNHQVRTLINRIR